MHLGHLGHDLVAFFSSSFGRMAPFFFVFWIDVPFDGTTIFLQRLILSFSDSRLTLKCEFPDLDFRFALHDQAVN